MRATKLKRRTIAFATVAMAAATVTGPAASAHPSTTRPNGNVDAGRDFDQEDFSHPLRINNKWVPMAPGTQLRFKGHRSRGNAPTSHTVIFTVTDLTKMVDGVRTTVIWDQDLDSGQLTESELAFMAQDDGGNVWNVGEYPEEYENGHLQGAPRTWIGGLRGAHPGILMLAQPRVGTASYSEGKALAVDFYDRAKVSKTDEHICAPLGCFNNVLVIDEWSPIAPEDGHQLKHYAAGVGNIVITPAGGEEETLELVSLVHLGEDALAKARAEAVKLDTRGHRISDVYRRTPPVKPR
jgi:hypothetical protein